MKKITFLILAIALIGFSAKAQTPITITTADMPVVGDNFAIANDSTNTTIGPGVSGPAVSWNFSTMVAQSVDSIRAVATGSTPFASTYPSANECLLAHIHGNAKDAYEYLNSGASGLALDGLEYWNTAAYPSPAYIAYKYNPTWLFVKVPATYKSSWSGKYRAVMKEYNNPSSGYDSLGIIEDGTYHDTIDGWGNLSTPFLASVSAIRNKHTETDIDSTIVHLVSTGKWITVGATKAHNNYYAWYAKGYHYSIVQISVDTAGKITQTQWMKSIVAGVNEVGSTNPTILYPDPANDYINMQIGATQAAYAYIMDMAGKQIEQIQLMNGRAHINTTYYAAGVYVYQVFDKSGSVIDRGKFSVVK